MQQLEENLGQLQLVTGYLKVYGSDTLFSLNFLSGLKVIGGEELVHGRYALYVLDNEKLQELWDWNHTNRSLNITKGKLFFQHNPSLCQELIYELAIKGGKNPDEDVHVSPAEDTGPCYKEDLEVRVLSQPERKLNVSWKYHFYGIDDRFVIGYYLYYREAPEEVRLYQGRDACNDNVVWEREFREYKRNQSCEVMLDKLKPYTQYAVYVDVYYTDSVKIASRSAINYIRTMVSDPSPVRNLKVEPQKNSSTLTVSWLPPAVANGPLHVYEVRYARLKHTSPGSKYLDRDDVCEDGKYEQHREASHIVPVGGGEEDAKTLCCNCSNSITSLSMEDRVFDRQLDINFENYIWQSVLCKSVTLDDDKGSTTPPVTSSESSAPATITSLDPTAAAGPGEERSRRRRRRSVSINPTGMQNRVVDKTVDAEEEKEVCKAVSETTSHGATAEECDERIVTTTTTSVTLTGLRHLTSYRASTDPTIEAVCLSVCLSVYRSIFICLSVFLSLCIHLYLSVCLSVSLSLSVSVSLSLSHKIKTDLETLTHHLLFSAPLVTVLSVCHHCGSCFAAPLCHSIKYFNHRL
nr:receptor tyrosine kinase InsR3A2 [Gecarcinus lateralis]